MYNGWLQYCCVRDNHTGDNSIHYFLHWYALFTELIQYILVFVHVPINKMNGNCFYRRWCKVNLILWQYFHTVIVRHNTISFRILYLGVMKFWHKIRCLCFRDLRMCSFFLQMLHTKLLLKVIPTVGHEKKENVHICRRDNQQWTKHG